MGVFLCVGCTWECNVPVKARIIGFRPGLELEAVVGAGNWTLYIEQCALLATESSATNGHMFKCLNGTLSIQMTQEKNRNKPENREQRVSG